MKSIILEGVVGSTAYGLARPGSDIDTKGIYVASIEDVLGLSGPEVVSSSISKTDPDIEMHEVGKYCKLALKCNPTVLEQMWLHDYTVLTREGQMLVQNRSAFLSEPAIRGSYGEYARAQAERLMRRNAEGKEGFDSSVKNRTEKHARHCTRLLFQGAQLLRQGTMEIDMTAHRDLIFEMGELAGRDPAAFYKYYEQQKAQFDEIEPVVTRFANKHKVNEILVQIRRWLA